MSHTKIGDKIRNSGKNYELKIYNILKNCKINNKFFNTQLENDIGYNNDFECNFSNIKIGIEVKKCTTPDWMQCSIKYNNINKKWEPSKNSKLPIECQNIFKNNIDKINIFDGRIPPFLEKKIRYNNWIDIKNNWKYIYINVDKNCIKELYKIKGCYYIQISNYGLYHLGNDICNFNVPEFNIHQQIRIRIKIHRKKDKNGYCDLSVIASFKPIEIKSLNKSKYSLDNIKKLPLNLKIL